MRINTGKYKGRDIKAPVGIRPTQNLVRKAFFDILGGVQGCSFLELFAGSGAVGFEALSRGARELVLVESNRSCLAAISRTIEVLKPELCSVYPQEADKAIESFFRMHKKFDIIFLDPPYYQDLAKKTLQTLEAYDILSPNGLIVLQHFKRENLPEDLGVLSLFRQSKYGDTLLSFYEKRAS
jgi:16S rRNA (guanine(966)-N(2))-methyltransferase RsmD